MRRYLPIYKIYMKVIFIIILFPVSLFFQGDAWADTEDQFIEKGKEYYQRGDIEHAAIAWEKAKELLETKGSDTGKYLDTVVHLAGAYQDLGYHYRAVDTLQQALPVVEKSEDRYRNTQFLSSLGDLYLSMGKMEESVPYMEKALAEAKLTKDPRVQASVFTDVGNFMAADGEYEGAKIAYKESLKIAESLQDDSRTESSAFINLFFLTTLTGNEKEIEDSLDRAMGKIQSMADSRDKARDLLTVTRTIQKFQALPDFSLSDTLKQKMNGVAYQALADAKDIAEKLGDSRTLSMTYGYMGQLYEKSGKYSDALMLTRIALFHAQQGDFPQILYLWQWQKGRIFALLGETENAVQAYEDAISTLNPIRAELFNGFRFWQDIFNTQVKPVYLGLAELLLNQAQLYRPHSKGEEVKLKAARDTMELLKTAELQDFFEDECSTVMQAKATTLDRTPPGTAVLYPIVLPQRLIFLLTLPDGIRQVRTVVDAATLEKTITRFRIRLQNRMNNRFLYDAGQLYEWIIRPIEGVLTEQKIKTLVIAPDGVLRMVPFTTLYDGERFLIEKYAMVIIPAITLTDLKPFHKENVQILLTGISESVQDFNPLPSVPVELRDIKDIMGGEIVLKDTDFTIANLRNEFQQKEYTIIHMATHGVFGGTPEDSFLLSYDGRLTMNRLEELISMGKYRENPVELLTLSACQTALGNERAALGLAGVAVKAGVRSAIASLWYVDDEATSLAIREFYRQLKLPGVSKAEALQNAQKTLIAQLRYWHPLYWAPFQLIGNWM